MSCYGTYEHGHMMIILSCCPVYTSVSRAAHTHTHSHCLFLCTCTPNINILHFEHISIRVIIILTHNCRRVALSLSDKLCQEVSKIFGPTTNYLLFTTIWHIIVQSPSPQQFIGRYPVFGSNDFYKDFRF